MFLFATLGFIVVQLDRQRKQRAQQVTGSRTEYLRYLGNVRQVAREAADQQRRALNWHHPDPSALPSLAEERSRVWEHGSSDADFLHVRYGVCSQPLSLELVPPESAPIDEVDPAAASALHRLLVVHRLQPKLPASIDLRAFDRVELCGAEDPARSLARAMICSATAFHSPDHLVVAVLCSEQNLMHWDWLKWLPHAQTAQQSDAVGPMRMVSTSLAEIATLLPPDLSDRPRFGADERPPSPHILFVTDGAQLPPGNHVIPPDGLHGVTVLDLPGPLGRARGRHPPAAPVRRRAGRGRQAADPRAAPPRGAGQGAGRPVRACRRPRRSPAAWRRCTPCPPGRRRWRDHRAHRLHGPAGLRRRLPLRPERRLAQPSGTRPAAGADRRRRRRHPDPPRHQGVRPAGHGPARSGHRRHRLRQVGVPPHARARPGHDALARAAEHGARRLQGRRDVRRHVRHAARLRGDHQPGPGAHPRRPHAGRPVRRNGAPPGAAPRRRQLRVDPRLRARPYRRRAARPAAVAVHRGRRVLGDAVRQAGVHRPLRRDRPPGPVARPPPAARLAAPGGGPAAWPRVPPVLPGRPAHVQRGRVAVGPRRTGRLRAPAHPGPGLPEARPVDAAAVQGRLRVRPAEREGASTPRRRRARAGDPPVHDLRGAQPGAPRAGARGAGASARGAGRAGVAPRRRGRADGGPRTGRAPGLAAAARRSRHPRPAPVRPDRGPQARRRVAPVARPRRPRRTAGHRRPSARAAPRHADRQPQRRVRARRRRRRSAQRQEHPAAHHRHQHVADHDAAGVPVLRARLRWRHVRPAGRPAPRRRRRHPLRARRRTPDHRRGAGDRGPSRGVLPRQRHRLDRDLPHSPRGRAGRRRVRRRLPGDRRLGDPARRLRRPRDGAPAAVVARPHLRPAHRHRRGPLGRLPCGHARRVRHPPRAAPR